ncbi:MAG: type II toxin-antitoxin system HicB family antitoxin [Nitrososphaerales archaeon]
MQSRELELLAVVTKEGKWYVALCPEIDVASQGKSIEEALKNLKEVVELYLEDDDARIPEAVKGDLAQSFMSFSASVTLSLLEF